MSDKSKGGRPQKNPMDVESNWKELMKIAYSDGKSDTWVRARVFKAISHELWVRWIDDIPEFSESVKAGKSLSQAYWEDISHDHAAGNNTDANATSLIFNMSNRFKDEWKQRQSVEQETRVVVELDDVKKAEQYLIDNGIDPSTL